MALKSPVDYLRKKEDSILPDDDTSNAEFLDPQDLASEDENSYGSQGGGTGSDFDDDGMEAGRTVAAKSAFAGPVPRPAAPSSPALDPSAYNAASQKVADIAGQRPGAPKPKWWQRLAAGAVGGLAGFSNSEGKAGPQINPAAAEDALLGGPQARRQLSDWQRQVDAATATQTAEQQKLALQQGLSKQKSLEALQAAEAKKAGAQGAQANAQAAAIEAEGKFSPDKDYIKMPGGGLFQISTGRWVNPPNPARDLNAVMKISPEKGKALGLEPDAKGDYYLPKEGAAAYLSAQVKPPKTESTQDQLLNAAAYGAAVKAGIHNKLDLNQPILPQLQRTNPDLATQVANDYRRDPNSEAMRELQMTATRLLISQRQQQQGPPVEIASGTPEFKVAQDLAYGKLTMQQFRSIYSYSRDINKKLALYNKASELNPNFNPAQFEMGYTLAKNPKVQQQLASLDNVMRAVPDLLKFSDAATRSGAPMLNKFIVSGGMAVGGKRYSDFKTAQIAFADELSGALGYGSATDMSREMGFNMTNPNLSPDQFRSSLENVVVPFIERKRSTMLNQMGPYGQPSMNPAASAPRAAPPANESQDLRREQHSASTNQYRHSLDGGKTWQPGQLPK